MSDEHQFINNGLDIIDETQPMSQPLELKKISKNDATRQESVPQLFAAINSGNVEAVEKLLSHMTGQINNSSYGGMTPLHAACHMQQLEILRLLIKRGAEIQSKDSLGNTALHVAVRERWSCGIEELLENGAPTDQISEPPNNVSGQLRETPLHAAIRTGNISYVSLMLKKSPDLSVRDRNNQTVFHLAAATRNVLILKQLLKEPTSAKILDGIGKGTYSLYHAALSSSCKVENEPSILKVIQVVYKCSEDVDVVNIHGETPLILACHLGLPNVVKFLLTNGANPTHLTNEKKSTIHSACISGCAETLKILLSTSKVNHMILEPDNDNCTPFNYAVDGSSVACCKTLLNNGEHLTNVGKDGISNCKIVLKKLPSAMQLFRELFDASVRINKKSEYDPDFSITFDYSVLMSSERKDMQSSIASDLAGTTLESLIKHPLLESFLSFKWCRIKPIFYFSVALYFIYVLLHSVFILLTYGANHVGWTDHENVLWFIRIMHVILIVLISFPALVFTFANIRKFVRQWETLTRIIAMTLSAYMVLVTDKKPDLRVTPPSSPNVVTSSPNVVASTPITSSANTELPVNQALASLSVFFVWVEFMMLLGRFPALGTYILMFTKVSKSLIKFIIAFLSLILAFSMCFHILFMKIKVFDTYSLSFVKTVIMMTGEIAYSEFIDIDNVNFGIFCQIVMTFFVFMVTVIMSNLLIGLAVNDIPLLKRLGEIKRLVKQASYLVAYELVVSYVYKSKIFPGPLRAFLSSRNSIKSVVTILPNKKIKSMYTQNIPEETLKEAIVLGHCESSEDFQPSMAEDVNNQLKAFQMRYSNDRRTQKNKFEELSVICGGIKRDIEKFQETFIDKITKILNQQQQTQTAINTLSQKNP